MYIEEAVIRLDEITREEELSKDLHYKIQNVCENQFFFTFQINIFDNKKYALEYFVLRF